MGEFRLGAPRGTFSFVDVRDVAAAQVRAFETGKTGRFIVGYDHLPSDSGLVRTIGDIEPQVRAPALTLPTFAALPLPLCDALSHRVFGTPRIATPAIIATLISGKIVNDSCARAKARLGWTAAIPFEPSLIDTIAELSTIQWWLARHVTRYRNAMPQPSPKRSANGKPPGPGLWPTRLFAQPGAWRPGAGDRLVRTLDTPRGDCAPCTCC